MNIKHVLLVEDDVELARLIKSYLAQHEITVTVCNHVQRANQTLLQQSVDLLLCDINLPGKSGFDLVAEIRNKFVGPILFLTAKTEMKYQLHGFELGAQDYLLKPIDPSLLLAKIKVFDGYVSQASKTSSIISEHNLSIEVKSKVVTLASTVVNLTKAEYLLLVALLQQFGQVVSREWLFQQHLGREYDGIDRTMDGRASRLRKKLQAVDPRWNVVTSWGEGYFLSFEEDSCP
ncbi:response regulator transcription factor [Psychrosphaera aquimarina]|uniref:Response regulator transcription factor n=1 Tax=Psychrosphaera aquimarina TaxID=2044854 RepID=A0ABU3QWS1_9GAMM|nr:response regulator transcription factor [Psychrosphaera aquimarina]MDU0111876.1 response regulator transcription factor [Psychrosphaera aquimarina]